MSAEEGEGTLDLIARLERWYRSQCNGDWEHTYGASISNIDNPGWAVDVQLFDTDLADRVFEPVNIQRKDEDDWILCRVTQFTWCGRGGPSNLAELLQTFLVWAENPKNEA